MKCGARAKLLSRNDLTSPGTSCASTREAERNTGGTIRDEEGGGRAKEKKRKLNWYELTGPR